jgi:hypothetical protein
MAVWLGYDMDMQKHIVELLKLFAGCVPDATTNAWVSAIAADPESWPRAHHLFTKDRTRNLAAISTKNELRESQYCFEEVCLKALFNETNTQTPFDSDSPFWIVPCAIELARRAGVPVDAVLDIVAPAPK